ncbi:gephyrin-like molybdotransferase Glp [Luminiphilus sp. nBUS_16]|uniref:molybdopterin molybdotransferase MoeA n=1 Tax=Luminiphilus sp. nBUS_16 TaxID=3395315 RepID=UPI003EBA4331
MALTPLTEARAQILAQTPAAPAMECFTLQDCLGRILSEDVVAARDVPPFDNSAMDGYALRYTDIPGPIPVSQRIPAGSAADALEPGTAARIFTGGVLPTGADTVVMQENTREQVGLVTVVEQPAEGANIRRRGSDIGAGDTVLRAGQLLMPQDLGLAASVGRQQLSVYRPLRVAVITTGDELVDPGSEPEPWQIFNSNGTQLCSQIRMLGMEPLHYPNLPDDPVLTGETLEAAAKSADCIITSGGVSVGEEDHVRAQIEQRGTLNLWKLALKPGKPFAFGAVAGCPIFGLPGNPVSSWVTFGLLVKPWLLAAQGAKVPELRRLKAVAAFSRPRPGTREEYLRVVLDSQPTPVAKLAGDQSSGVLSSAGRASALAVIPAGTTLLEGDALDVILVSEFLSPAATL